MGTKYPGTTAETRALDAFIKLVRAAEAVSRRLQSAFLNAGLTETQFGALEALFHLGPLSQKELGGKLLRSGSNMTLVLDNLGRAGLVRRERDPDDRRIVRVSLTPRGSQLIRRIMPQHVRRVVEEFKVLSAAEQDRLQMLCRMLGRARVVPERPNERRKGEKP